MKHSLGDGSGPHQHKTNAVAPAILLGLGLFFCVAPLFLFFSRSHALLEAFRVLDRLTYWEQFATFYFRITTPILLFILMLLICLSAREQRRAYREQRSEYFEQKESGEVEKAGCAEKTDSLVNEGRKDELSKVFFNLLNYKLATAEALTFFLEDQEFTGQAVIEAHRRDFGRLLESYKKGKEIVDDKIERYEKGFVGKKAMVSLIGKNLDSVDTLELHMKNIRPYVKYLLLTYKTIKSSTVSFDIADYVALFFSQIGESELYVIAYYGSELFKELGLDPFAFFIEAEMGTQLVSIVIKQGAELARALEWRSTTTEISIAIAKSMTDEN